MVPPFSITLFCLQYLIIFPLMGSCTISHPIKGVQKSQGVTRYFSFSCIVAQDASLLLKEIEAINCC